ncbi:hypothetical protein GXB85_13355 [Cellulomonas sp. APG4]|uniref:hypothetical protein n=1 Tax=Cellulomonas sp. APG4 TaxID=1538656 RepID=UPI00137AC87E|nr:hypothetical protein [Cellulomonas sp. APG4]NCT91933.1 hypothetical protein [Cellulomonas sp. APG4]
MSRPVSTLRRAVVVPLALATAAGLSACSATNPITTTTTYAASDGVRVELDDVRLGNVIVLSSAEGAPGVVVGQITNDGDEDVRVTLGVDGALAEPVAVDARGTALLSPDGGDEVTLDAVPVAPGAYVELQIAVDGGATTTAQVPVLDGTLPEYADLVPDAG